MPVIFASIHTISGAEYFFDTDPGEGQGYPLQPKDGSFNTYEEEVEQEITLPELTVGIHYLYVRMKNENNIWGLTQKHLIMIAGQKKITAAQYAIRDQQGAQSDWLPLSPADGAFNSEVEEIVPYEIDTISMPVGGYTIYVRMQDSNGIWGIPRGYAIEVRESPQLVTAEFFIDEDPGKGNAFPLTAVDGLYDEIEEDILGELDSANLTVGTHTLYIRGKDSNNVWTTDPISIPFDVYTSDVGTMMPIIWDTQNIPGNVMISLSRQGGKIGTFETIVQSTENDGRYEWTVTGPGSNSCVLKILPLASASAYIVQEPFTISDIKYRIISNRIDDSETFDLSFKEIKSFSEDNDINVMWSVSNSAAAYIQGNELFPLKTACVDISTSYDEQLYSKKMYVRHVETENILDHYELDYDNNTITSADRMNECYHIEGELLNDDVDYFKFSLKTDALIELDFMTKSQVMNAQLSILSITNDTVKTMASAEAKNGEDIHIQSGLVSGDYYIKLTPSGEIDQNSSYVIVYKHLTNITQSQNITNISQGGKASSQILNHDDIQQFSFQLEERQQVVIHFLPSSETADYLITISNANEIIDEHYSIDGQSLSIDSIFGQGEYIIAVSSNQDIDAGRPFDIYVQKNDSLMEVESNDTVHNATPLRLNENCIGNFTDEFDTDIYTINIDAPSFIDLYFESQGGSGEYFVSIFKNSLDNLINGIRVVENGTLVFPFGLTIGKYYIQISPVKINEDFSEKYLLALSPSQDMNFEIESNNNPKFANAIGSNHSLKGRIFSESDIDYFGFQLKDRAFIEINFVPSSTMADYKVELVGQNYEKYSNDGEGLTIKLIKTEGEYYIKVENNGDIDPYSDYELSVNANASEIIGLVNLVNISINTSQSQLSIGESFPVTVMGHYSDATTHSIGSAILSSLNNDIAIIKNNNIIEGISSGYASIVANYGHLSAKLIITVGSPEQDVKQHYGNLILVAGGGHSETDALFYSTQYLSDHVYKTFKDRLFKDEDIFYFNPILEHDIDKDGLNDNIVDSDKNFSIESFNDAIETWAIIQKTDGPLYIYLIDHGGIDTFKLNDGQILKAEDLRVLLDNFQQFRDKRAVVVTIEACKSGSFIDNLTNDEFQRVIVTSNDERDTYQQLNGEISFTQFFIDSLLTSNSIYESWQDAIAILYVTGSPYNKMKPMLVETKDSSISKDLYIGGKFVIAGLIAEFDDWTPSSCIYAGNSMELYAKVSTLDTVHSVWALIQPPDYDLPDVVNDFQVPVVTHPIINLYETNGNGIYKGVFDQFSYNGLYRIVFFVRDSNNHVNISDPTYISVKGGENLKAHPKGDINWDGRIDVEDVIVALKYISGFRSVPVYPFNDINGDNVIDLSDIVSTLMTIGDINQ